MPLEHFGLTIPYFLGSRDFCFLAAWTILKCGHILDLVTVRTAPLKRSQNVKISSQHMTAFPFIFSTSSFMPGILFILRVMKSQWLNRREAHFSFTWIQCGSAGPPSGIQGPSNVTLSSHSVHGFQDHLSNGRMGWRRHSDFFSASPCERCTSFLLSVHWIELITWSSKHRSGGWEIHRVLGVFGGHWLSLPSPVSGGLPWMSPSF